MALCYEVTSLPVWVEEGRRPLASTCKQIFVEKRSLAVVSLLCTDKADPSLLLGVEVFPHCTFRQSRARLRLMSLTSRG